MDSTNLLEKAVVEKMKCDLKSIYDVLNAAFDTLAPAKDANLVVAIGNTGCGKSTMLSSIIFGPESLHYTQITEQVKVMRRRGKQQQEEFKTKKRWVIEQKEPQGEFSIGHSVASSKTFLPCFRKRSADSDILYADIAGLLDTSGDLIDYINCFVNKKLFSLASKVKILFPIPYGQLYTDRSGQILEQVRVLQNTCQESPATMINSVLPILTRCKQVGPDDENADEAVDLDAVKGLLFECFGKELERQFQDIREAFPDLENADSEAKDEDQIKQLNEMKAVQEFFNKYVGKVRIFDPLDRPTPSPEVDLATKRDELVHLIQEMPAIPGNFLVVPLSNDLNRKLEKMFDSEKEACNEIIEEYCKKAQEESDFSGQLSEDPKIKEFLEILKFFAEHELIRYARREYIRYQEHVSKMQNILEKEKDMKNMSRLQTLSLQLYKDMHRRKEENNYPSMTKIMIDYNNVKCQLEGRTEPNLVQTREGIANDINELVRGLDSEQLFKFAYCLRQKDIQDGDLSEQMENLEIEGQQQAFNKKADDHYTIQFLNGNLKNPILFDIIIGNKWDPQSKRMVVNNSTAFQIFGGKDFGLQLKCKKSFDNYEWPYAMKPDIQEQKSGDFFTAIKKMAAELLAEPMDKVKFVLTRSGVYIEDVHDKNARVVCHQGEVEQGSYQYVSWATAINTGMVDDSKTNCWTLTSPFEIDPAKAQDYEEAESIFCIQMPYGEIRPRLSCNKEDPFLYTKLSSTTRQTDGYSNPNQSWWKIKKAE